MSADRPSSDGEASEAALCSLPNVGSGMRARQPTAPLACGMHDDLLK